MSKKSEKKKAKVQAKVQAKKVAKPIGRPSDKAPADGVIKVLTAKNPKRSTSAAGKRFDLYKPGMTVQKFLDAGGLRADLSWDLKQGFIEIQKPA